MIDDERLSRFRIDLFQNVGGDLDKGFYVQPTVFEGDNAMRIFQEEIFGPVVSVTSFRDYDHAIELAEDRIALLDDAIDALEEALSP